MTTTIDWKYYWGSEIWCNRPEGKYNLSKDESIHAGLTDLIALLEGTPWVRTDGEVLTLKRGVADIGYMPEIVKDVIRGTKFIGIAGIGIEARNKGMNDYKLGSKDVKDYGWKGNVRWVYPAYAKFPYINADANFWKSFVYERFGTPTNKPGAFHLYGNHRTNHRLFAQHLMGEAPQLTVANGRSVPVWKPVASGRDNHWLDTTAYACCVAAYEGITPPGYVPPPEKPKRPKVNAREAQRKARRYTPGVGWQQM